MIQERLKLMDDYLELTRNALSALKEEEVDVFSDHIDMRQDIIEYLNQMPETTEAEKSDIAFLERVNQIQGLELEIVQLAQEWMSSEKEAVESIREMIGVNRNRIRLSKGYSIKASEDKGYFIDKKK